MPQDRERDRLDVLDGFDDLDSFGDSTGELALNMPTMTAPAG